MNLLDESQLSNFNNYQQQRGMSELLSTTMTVEGEISGLKFNESTLIKTVTPDEDIVVFRCNFGVKVHPRVMAWFERNRKKKPKKLEKSTRKMQGSGTDFNSQITCFVRSRFSHIDDFNIVVYKFKVFRTGKIQLPGVHPNNIRDVIDCSHLLARKLSQIICEYAVTYPEVVGDAAIGGCELLAMRTIMQNSKFCVLLQPRQQINLYCLHQAIATNTKEIAGFAAREVSTESPSRECVSLSILFIDGNKKKNHVNVFARGKINLLGVNSSDISMRIYRFISEIIFNTAEYAPGINTIATMDSPPPVEILDNFID